MSMRKMLQLAMSLTLLIALLGGGMGAWAAASNQEPTPEGRDWEPTPWPYPPQGPTWTPPPSETPYDGQVYVPEPTPEGRDWEPTPWPYPPQGPTWTPPDTPPDGAGAKTQEVTEVPAGDVEIAAISSGVERPFRSGLDAHGRAWTQARHEPGRITWVFVDVWLWWWDGSRWIHVGTGSGSASVPCWRGLITASGQATRLNALTGWYVVESFHRVYVDGARVYGRRRFSEQVWLTFP